MPEKTRLIFTHSGNPVCQVKMESLIVSPELEQLLPQSGRFDHVMGLRGETFREKDGRHTFRIRLGEDYYFIKQHNGVGYGEILKELTTLKWPIVSARNEYLAIEYLQSAGIATMEAVAFGERGLNPATRQSFVITREIPHTHTLKTVTDEWLQSPPSFGAKRTLLREISRIARLMHEKGANHRDFYLCHFRIDQEQAGRLEREVPELYLMDLHRVQIRPSVPSRWRVKDVAALYFSAAHLPISRWDALRFIRYYSGKPLKQTLREDRRFWQRVLRRARKFYRREWNAELPLLWADTQ